MNIHLYYSRIDALELGLACFTSQIYLLLNTITPVDVLWVGSWNSAMRIDWFPAISHYIRIYYQIKIYTKQLTLQQTIVSRKYYCSSTKYPCISRGRCMLLQLEPLTCIITPLSRQNCCQCVALQCATFGQVYNAYYLPVTSLQYYIVRTHDGDSGHY